MRWNGIQTGTERWIQKVRKFDVGGGQSGGGGVGEVLTEGMMNRNMERRYGLLWTERLARDTPPSPRLSV